MNQDIRGKEPSADGVEAPVVSAAGEGQLVEAFGTYRIRMSARDTAGRLGLMEADVLPGDGAPAHVHAREDEFFRVLSGTFSFLCGEHHVELQEGGCILLPRGVPHQFKNVGDDIGRLMIIVTPGGFEGFFPTVEELKPAGPSEVEAIAAGFGLAFLASA